MRKGGLEPPRVLPHRILNPARLPIPPLSRKVSEVLTQPPVLLSIPEVAAPRIQTGVEALPLAVLSLLTIGIFPSRID